MRNSTAAATATGIAPLCALYQGVNDAAADANSPRRQRICRDRLRLLLLHRRTLVVFSSGVAGVAEFPAHGRQEYHVHGRLYSSTTTRRRSMLLLLPKPVEVIGEAVVAAVSRLPEVPITSGAAAEEGRSVVVFVVVIMGQRR